MTDRFDIVGALEATFDTKPVSIIDFAESAKFCGKFLYPRQKLLLKLFFLEELTDLEERLLDSWIAGGSNGTEVEISPYIRERRQWLKDNGYKHFREIVLVGGRRSAKGFITGMSLAKKMYDTLQLQDPGRHYGIDRDKEIVFSCIAAAEKQAKEMQFADFATTVNGCAAMGRNIHKMQELEFSVMTESDIRQLQTWRRQGRKVQRDISKLRGKALPANARTIRGSATMAIVFDEFAHFQQGESDQSDSEVYAAATPALAQFGPDAMIFANSSPYSKVGKFFERYDEGMATNNAGPAAPQMLALRFPSWATFDGWWEDPTYKGPKKCITVSPDWDFNKVNDDGSFFFTEDDRQSIIIAREEERQDPVKFKVERRAHFAEVVDAFLIPERIDQMFMGRPLPEGGYDKLLTNRWDSTYRLRYKAHLDPSSTTSGFGFALGHTEILSVPGSGGEPVQNHHVIFDIIKRWNPSDFPERVIEWDPILQEIMGYIDVFRPYELTMDQFNSAYPLQWIRRELRKRRLHETHVYEKTANSQGNWDRAEIFRTALYQGLVHAPYDHPDCDYAGLELKFLQEIKTGRVPRVDKQEMGPVTTKDMADCVMTVTEDLIGNLMSQEVRVELAETPLSVTAMGGYPIAGSERASASHPEFGAHYKRRIGEQMTMGGKKRNPGKVNPARRVAGGRPLPRKLPGW